MFETDTTKLFKPIDVDDVIQMHGATWVIKKRCNVRIEEITDPLGSNVGAQNWRSSYEGATGDAIFASRMEAAGERWVVQVRHLTYTNEEGHLVTTNDLLRTSSGTLKEENDLLVFTSRRTRYVFSLQQD